MKRRLVLAAVVVLTCIVMCLPVSAKPKISASQAKVMAMKFFEKVGWKTSDKPTFVASGSVETTPNFVYVIKAGKFAASIDPFNSILTSASSRDYKTQIQKKPIAKTTALKKALVYAKATGVYTRDMKPITVTPSLVVFARYYKGYPFLEQLISVRIYSGDGSLIKLNADRPSPKPASLSVKVNKQKAEDLSKNTLKNLSDLVLKSQKLMIVQPNNYFGTDPNAKRDMKQNVSRLAWVSKYSWDKSHVAEVWVDASTGDVLGGMKCK